MSEKQEQKNEDIREFGQVALNNNRENNRISLLTIIGEIEGHDCLPATTKTTKYEHVLPKLAEMEDNRDTEGILLLLNTVGGDVESGLAIAEMIASISKPTVSLVLGGSHSIGVPLAVSTDYSFIVPSGTMVIHPVRMSGTVIGAKPTYDYFKQMQNRILTFIASHSKAGEERLEELMMNTGMLTKDLGTILVGEEAVREGLIDAVGGIDAAFLKLHAMIDVCISLTDFYESDKEAAMSLLQAILMGIIQGLTEFLPVSSSGHLALFKILFDVNTDTGILYDVLLHVGTLIAISLVYYRDILKLVVDGCCIIRDAGYNVIVFFRNKTGKEQMAYRRVINSSYRKFAMLIIVSTIPTGIIGYFCKDVVEMASEILIVPGICLIATAVLLLIADHCKDGDKLPKNVTYTDAFSVGIAQGIATLPGLSRSGTTITACLLAGYQRNFAVKYSFLMSIPAILGALVLELKDATDLAVSGTEVVYYVIGMAVAAVVGYVCIKTMLVIVRKKKFTVFAIYCLLVGALSIGGYFYLA